MKTNLTPIRVRIVEDPDGGDPHVQVAYSYTTSDGEVMSKTRDGVWTALTAAQQTTISNLLAGIRARISNVEGI